VLPLGHRGFQESRPSVETRQSMARAGDKAEELRGRVEKVEDLRDEEQ